MMAPFLAMEMLTLACRVRLDLRDLLHQTHEDYKQTLTVALERTAAYSKYLVNIKCEYLIISSKKHT